MSLGKTSHLIIFFGLKMAKDNDGGLVFASDISSSKSSYIRIPTIQSLYLSPQSFTEFRRRMLSQLHLYDSGLESLEFLKTSASIH